MLDLCLSKVNFSEPTGLRPSPSRKVQGYGDSPKQGNPRNRMRAFGNSYGNSAFNSGSSNALASRIDNNGIGNKNNKNNTATVEITNWEGGSKDDVIIYLERKSRVKTLNASVRGSILVVQVRSHDLGPFTKLSGIRYAGQVLRIVSSSSDDTGGANSTIAMLKTFLESRYNQGASALDLQGLKNDQFLIQNNLFSSVSTSSKMFPALMKVASKNMRFVDTVNLGGNGLNDISPVQSLAETYPDLKNLSLANNNIRNIRGLDDWRMKLRNLRELVLTGNPIVNDIHYKDQIVHMFPRLVMLDGQIVRDEKDLDTLKLPLPIKHIFFEDSSIEQLAGNFISSYFDLFDKDRTQLLQLYDQTSIFSLSVNTSAPRQMAGTPAPGHWSSYIPMSRNLLKVTSANGRLNRMYIGTGSINSVFKRLPSTIHNMAPEKVCIDAWRTVAVREENDTGIIITVHGEYREKENRNNLRSFDRTFIVVQSPNGSMILASDILTVRPYAGSDAWQESTSQPIQQQPIQQQPNATPTRNIPPELNGLNNDQLMMIEQLMQQTRLNAQYARMCAEQANFDPANAMALFQQSHAQLPPDAFVNS